MRRTDQQRKAIEVYCRELAKTLNDSGFEMKKVFEAKAADIPWNQTTVKEVLWKPIQMAMFEKGSTTELTTGEVNEVYEVLNRHIGENFGISVEFPNEGDE